MWIQRAFCYQRKTLGSSQITLAASDHILGEIEDWQSSSNLEDSGNTIRTVNIEYSEENQFVDLNSEQVSIRTYHTYSSMYCLVKGTKYTMQMEVDKICYCFFYFWRR